jgi:AcrR family transcriptional regulator
MKSRVGRLVDLRYASPDMATTQRRKNKMVPSRPQPKRRNSKGKPSRIRLNIEERRAQLLELGIKLFSKHGYDDISIDAVAEAAGMCKGLLYHYFGSKREFYVATIQAASMQLQSLTRPDSSLPHHERFVAALDKHLDYIKDHKAVYQAMYRSGPAVAPEVSKILDAHRNVILRYFMEGLGVSKPKPLLRTALRAWMAMVEGASLDWVSEPVIPRQQLRDLFVAAYVAMLGKIIEEDPETAQVLASSIAAA